MLDFEVYFDEEVEEEVAPSNKLVILYFTLKSTFALNFQTGIFHKTEIGLDEGRAEMLDMMFPDGFSFPLLIRLTDDSEGYSTSTLPLALLGAVAPVDEDVAFD